MRNTAIETIAVSYIVQSQDMNILTRNNFTHKDFKGNEKEVVKFLEQYVENYNTVPSEEVVKYEMGSKYSSVIINDSPLYIESALQAHFNYNVLHGSILKNQERLTAGSPEDIQKAIEDIISSTEEGLSRLRPRSSGTDLVKDRGRVQEYTDKLSGEGGPVYDLGIPTLDEAFGGVVPDDLVIVYARPAVGKSYMLTYMASQLHKQGLNVLFYSGEMLPTQVGYRFDSIRANVSNRSLMRGYHFPEGGKDYTAYHQYLEELEEQDNFFRIVHPKDDFKGKKPTVTDIEALVDELKPDVVFIDQLSLMDDSKRARDIRERYINIIGDLRLLAEVKEVPVFVASQANRQSAQKNDDGEFMIPELHHLAEADAVGQFATRVIGLASKRTEDRNVQILKMGITKNRHGTLEEFQMMVDFDKGHIHEIVPEEVEIDSGKELPF